MIINFSSLMQAEAVCNASGVALCCASDVALCCASSVTISDRTQTGMSLVNVLVEGRINYYIIFTHSQQFLT